MISIELFKREADPGRRPAGIAVQHRDHDRHVGAADRNDRQDAEHERDRLSSRQMAATVLPARR